MKESATWMKIRPAAEYAGVSPDLFEAFIKDGLPYSQPRKMRLFNRADIDQYLERHKVARPATAQQIADEMADDLLSGKQQPTRRG